MRRRFPPAALPLPKMRCVRELARTEGQVHAGAADPRGVAAVRGRDSAVAKFFGPKPPAQLPQANRPVQTAPATPGPASSTPAAATAQPPAAVAVAKMAAAAPTTVV